MTETYKVGITGAGGFIGSRVTSELLEENHEVVATDNFHAAKVDKIKEEKIRELDVRDRSDIRETFEDVDIIMHLGAISGVDECRSNPELGFDVNVRGTENVAWICRENGIPLVFAGSIAVIGDPVEFPITADHPRDPLHFYGTTKTMNEEDVKWLSRDSFPAHILIKSNLYGVHEIDGEEVGKDMVINIFVEQALNREPMTVHKPGTQSFDFVHIKDVARSYLDSMYSLMEDDDTGSDIFTVASGECLSVLEIAEMVQRIVEEERDYTPEMNLIENPREAEPEAEDFTVDTSEAREKIGFEAERDVETTIREMVRNG